MGRVVVVGSINVDLVCRAERQPRPGETVLGSEFATHPGGKGANQAVAAARSEAETWMVGRVGTDAFGDAQIDFLQQQGIRTDRVLRSDDVPTGVALITVSAEGENSIVVVPGANGRVSQEDVNVVFEPEDVVVCQFEIPLETVVAVLRCAHERGARTILNPAPAAEWPSEYRSLVDVLVVNESELAFLAGGPEPDPADTRAVAERVAALRAGPNQTVVATLGSHGLVAATGAEEMVLAGHSVRAVDTTAAGDTFVGAFAASLARGAAEREALEYANLAAAISVERAGAGPSIPARAEIEARRD